MKKIFYLIFCIIILTFSACSPISVPTNSEKTTTLSTEYITLTETTEITNERIETFPETNESSCETVLEAIPDAIVNDTDSNVELPSQNEETFTEAQTEQEIPTVPEYVGSIALTFDDGPGIYTERLLNILKRYDAKATFFVVGNRASYQKDILKRMSDEGHEVGNHTFNHLSLKSLLYQEIIDQISITKDIIESATGEENKLVRAPYGDLSSDVYAAGGELNVTFIHWSLDTLDWMTRDPQRIYDEIIYRVSDGDIILLHDIHESTIDAMEMVIPDLINNGYKLVTVSELLTEESDYIYPGAVYSKK